MAGYNPACNPQLNPNLNWGNYTPTCMAAKRLCEALGDTYPNNSYSVLWYDLMNRAAERLEALKTDNPADVAKPFATPEAIANAEALALVNSRLFELEKSVSKLNQLHLHYLIEQS